MHPEVIGRGQRFTQWARLVAEVTGRDGVWTTPLAEVAAHVRPVLESTA
jgi:hypothetical protein